MNVVPAPTSILITGASGGIGAALALAYARPGVRLALTGRDQARLAGIAGACREAGAKKIIVTGLAADAAPPAAGIRCGR